MFVLILFILWVFVWFTSLHWASSLEKFWTTLLFFVCAFPSVAYVGGHRFHIPLLPMWGLGYFAMFGMPVLTMERSASVNLYNQTQNSVVDALRLAALGGVGCLATAYTSLGAWIEKTIPRWQLPWDPTHAGRAGILLIFVGLGAYYSRFFLKPLMGVHQFLFVVSQFSTIGTLTLFLLQLRSRLPLWLKFFLWGFAFPVQMLLALGTGALWDVVRTASPLFFCYAAERRRIPWAGLLAFSLCIIPFLGTKGEYRSYAWYGEDSPVEISESAVGKGLAFIKLTLLRMKEGGLETYTVAAETAESRVNHLELLVTLREMTPSIVPFWNGHSYTSLLWAFVPRILYPSKPTKTTGNEFGQRYSILHQDDDATSVNLPHQVLEMYINFGIPAIFIGMAAIGLIYRAVLAFLDRPETGERGLIIGCTLLASLLSLDSDFSLVFGGVIYYVLLMIFFTRFLRPHPGTIPA